MKGIVLWPQVVTVPFLGKKYAKVFRFMSKLHEVELIKMHYSKKKKKKEVE